MTGRQVAWFLRDRLGLIVAWYANTAVIMLLISLLLTGQAEAAVIRANLGYGLVLASTVLAIYLAIAYVRWAPFVQQAARLAQQEAGREALANLPPGANREQALLGDLLSRLYSLSAAEQVGYREAYQRHLTFMNLWVHQMKTPVAAINLVAQRAMEKPPEEWPAAMESIAEETARLSDGLELVLNMARLQEFAVDFRIEPVDLLAAVRKLINQRRKQFIRAAIYPEIDAPDGNWTVLTDAKWNSVVIEQLIANALKYGSQGGPAGQRLTLRLRREGRTVTLAVIDQGPGIPAEDLPRIFEPFFTGANGRRFADATGIGLYIVRQVTRELGHEVQVTSQLGAGTTVTLTYCT